jgi:KDO2-lipid IV(A) lauroyltransferase
MPNVVRDYVRYPLEAALAVVVYGLFMLLPIDAASALGGWIGRALGPRLGLHRRALGHIGLAMPETDPARREQIALEMWDNLGRVLGEFPHVSRIAAAAGEGGRIEVVGARYLDPLRASGTGGILFSGHLANWELSAPSLSALGIGHALIYREPSNPLVRRMIRAIRHLPPEMQLPKGARGARGAIDVLRHGGWLGMLVDQKMNDGIAVPFFGRQAMTPPALAQLGLKFDCPVVPAHLERIGGCRFRLSFHPPMDLPRTGDRRADVLETMTRVNRMLEEWIRDRPGQWLWLHRRWPADSSASVSPPSSDRREAPDRAAS